MQLPRAPRVVEVAMTLCPIALTVGCKKCPAFAFCPAKSFIGDYEPKKDTRKSAESKKPKTGKQPS
jgi:hypothetical protein